MKSIRGSSNTVTRVASLLSILWLCLWPAAGHAHVMQVPYNLPVPFWLYAYGATGALLASFLVVGYFVRADAAHAGFRSIDVSRTSLARMIANPAVIGTFRTLGVLLLLLTIVSGFLGLMRSGFASCVHAVRIRYPLPRAALTYHVSWPPEPRITSM